MERDGEIVTKVVPNRRRKTLMPLIKENVKLHSIVHTDEHTPYITLGQEGYYHEMTNHAAEQYVSPKGSSVNGIEGFWSQLKRTINGTHIHVSGKHLWAYAKEAEYRFNRRDCSEAMLSELLGTFGPLPSKSD